MSEEGVMGGFELGMVLLYHRIVQFSLNCFT